MTFYKCGNNGVVAVVTVETFKKIEERAALARECTKMNLPYPTLPPVLPIFTFSDPEHPAFRFMTGNAVLMEWLLAGHNVISSSFYVPFSNGDERSQDPETAKWENLYRTNLNEALVAFNLQRESVEEEALV